MQKLQIKNEDTWYNTPGHYRCRIRYSPERIQGVVARTAFYTILRNPNGNRYVLYLNWNGNKWNWNYNWLDNDWNGKHVSVVLPVTLFISLLDFYQESFVS